MCRYRTAYSPSRLKHFLIRGHYIADRGLTQAVFRSVTDRSIIFVPGMRPKPMSEAHRDQLCRVLAAALERARPGCVATLSANAECLTLISWTYRFYDHHRDIGLDLPGIEQLLTQPEPSVADRREIDSVSWRLARFWRWVGDTLPMLGRLIAKPDLRRAMLEAVRYQHNEEGIGSEIRHMVKDAIETAWAQRQHILMIGHSLGSVIAYDAMWELSHEARHPPAGTIDLFMTFGSPLATRFIRGRLRGQRRSGRTRYPTIIRHWENYAARGDTTAFRPRLRPCYGEMLKLGQLESLTDHIDLYTHFRGDGGLNPHEAYGYLNHPAIAGRIAAWFDETS